MPFYGDRTRDECVSTIDQDKFGNCYIVAPVAAYSLLHPEVDLKAVVKVVGYGMGGTSDRAFKALGLTAFNKGQSSYWRELITSALELPECFLCLGITWTAQTQRGATKTGNHVVYVIGYEGDVVFARDQQNGHVLIAASMATWTSEPYMASNAIFNATVTWVGAGCGSKEAAKALLKIK